MSNFSEFYFADTKSKAVFASNETKPQMLFNTPTLKALVVGLNAGQQIPVHPSDAAMYHFLEGEGLMTVGEETFDVKPGVTIIAPKDVKRGVNAKTRIIFLAAKGG